MAKTEKNENQQEIPRAQRAFVKNPLAPHSPEESEALAKDLQEIRINHQRTKAFVNKKFVDEPKPVWVDKGL